MDRPVATGGRVDFLFDPVGDIGKVPFPGLSVVVGEGLAPEGMFGVGNVPSKHDDDGSSYLIIFCEEEADPVMKRADLRWVQRAAVAVHPIQAPEPCFWVEGADGPAFVYFAIGELATGNIKVAVAFEAGVGFRDAFEFGVFLTVRQPGVQVFVPHLPFSDPKIKIFAGGFGGSGNDQIAVGGELQRRHGETVDLGGCGVENGYCEDCHEKGACHVL